MVGTDIIEVDRIEKLIKEKGDRFLNRIYTQNEIDYCESKGSNKYQHYAGRFAAKEAVFKAVADRGTEVSDVAPLKFKNIQIKNDKKGLPYVYIVPDPLGIGASISVSISHIKKYAVAVAFMGGLADY
tara:strand:+ start:279 stop:662 length:384 start_codon:yes stop_codon:yes gene_type:complete